MLFLLTLACSAPTGALVFLGQIDGPNTGFAWLGDDADTLLVGDGDGSTGAWVPGRRGMKWETSHDLAATSFDVVLDARESDVLVTAREDADAPRNGDTLIATTWAGEQSFALVGVGASDARLTDDGAIAYDDRACTITFLANGAAAEPIEVPDCRPGAFATDPSGVALVGTSGGVAQVDGTGPANVLDDMPGDLVGNVGGGMVFVSAERGETTIHLMAYGARTAEAPGPITALDTASGRVIVAVEDGEAGSLFAFDANDVFTHLVDLPVPVQRLRADATGDAFAVDADGSVFVIGAEE